ncbi:MAG: hypothetical protein L0Z55_08830 [Planctomycetes bacterium]|nr:hypothetical protein [Planctomycetota bacterium]
MGYYLCGLDEAGYGPTLGPLVVGLTTFESKERLASDAPWQLLRQIVARAGERGVLRVDDSKALHRSAARDLSPLEGPVLAFVACEQNGALPASFRELVRHLTAGRTDYLDEYPWYREADVALPVGVDRLELLGFARKLRRALAAAGLQVAEIRAIPIEVRELNAGIAELESKGAVNARAVGRFLNWIWRQQRGVVDVWTDRLGGRRRYGGFLYPLFPGARFDILEQGIERQIYRAANGDESTCMTMHFATDCERVSFSTALASMTAKYLRELHMLLFNNWWRARLPELRPTAGYTQDARRFLAEIEPHYGQFGVETNYLVRAR